MTQFPSGWNWLKEYPKRERYARAAMAGIPRLLGLVDRNPLSRTYGCFDRSYWHYRTMDFPCGMNQEFLLPLALAYAEDLPGGKRYRGAARLRDICIASMHFAEKASHPDGTCDDYFPFERAMGALVFSLYAMTESCLVLGLEENMEGYSGILDFFVRRGDHLGRENETGQLANHQAFAALALYNVYLLTGDEKYKKFSNERRDITLDWQNKEEGWFQEYEGADPGYHSCSIAFLSKLAKKSDDWDMLHAPLEKACKFARNFMHPDGSYAGEYGSRNTYHFYPHGFEMMAGRGVREAAEICDLFLERGLPEGRRYFNDDDRMCAHYLYDWVHAYQDFAEERPENSSPAHEPGKLSHEYFPKGGLASARQSDAQVVVNLRKGGVLKAITEAGPFLSDTGPLLEDSNGAVLVAHLMKPVPENAGAKTSEGSFSAVTEEAPLDRRSHPLPTPFKQILFRVATLTVGRFNANFVRSTLQKILITGKKPVPHTHRRQVIWSNSTGSNSSGSNGEIEIIDDLKAGSSDSKFRRLVFAPDATSIYVANSNTYQESVLLPNLELPQAVEHLNTHGNVRIHRVYQVGQQQPSVIEILPIT